jgi:hypothetical protein
LEKEKHPLFARIKSSKPYFYTSIFLGIAFLFFLPVLLTVYFVFADVPGIDKIFWLIVSAISAAILMLFTFIGMLLTLVSWLKKRDRKVAEYLFLINLVLFLTPVGLVYGFFQYQDYKRIRQAKQHYETLNLDQKLAYQLTNWGNQYSRLPFGDEKDIQRLIRDGANIDALDAQGLSPLCKAVNRGYRTRLVQFILDNGASKHQFCVGGLAAVHIASKYCGAPNLEVLAKNNVDLTALSQNQETPYELMLKNFKRNPYNCIQTALVFHKYGIDITQQDEDGNTLLHVAASRTSKHFLQQLVKAGLDPKIKNNKGQTASMVAKESYQKKKYSTDHPAIRYLEELEK